ncbi:site-specific integrase [Aeromicrobium piscarium]|uniref:Site-specific integrase n=1 Tax=Aeromicrobium piscarium TaxID=2590901 RepID=A0A554S8X5_9ACTN|nr:site-specific integrase [Aeromicrobium piscarium]TSD62806.1 site-specific integrase [Aeromicrobium piscarium]
MASKSIAKRPNGKWRARYRDNANKEHAKHFDRKVDAQRWLDEVTTSIVTGQYVNPNAGKTTLREYAEQWRRAQPHRETTRQRTESQFRNHVYPAFGDVPIANIKPSDVQAWVQRLATPDPESDRKNGGALQPRTIAVVHGMIHGVFAAAVRDRKIASNPCADTRLPKPEKSKVIPMTMDQLDRLTEAMPEHLKALVTLTAGTGLRQGETFGLTIDRIDFLRRTVTVNRQLQYLEAGPKLVRPKTDASVRDVPLPQVVVDALAAHVAAHGTADLDGEQLVFSAPEGAPYRRSRFSDAVWRPAVKSAGLPEGTRFHDLRHLYASLLIRHGESVKTVQARLGHASAAETLDTYSHLWPDSDDTTRAAVDAAFSHRIEGGGATEKTS